MSQSNRAKAVTSALVGPVRKVRIHWCKHVWTYWGPAYLGYRERCKKCGAIQHIPQ